jgi:hypothetical protein
MNRIESIASIELVVSSLMLQDHIQGFSSPNGVATLESSLTDPTCDARDARFGQHIFIVPTQFIFL